MSTLTQGFIRYARLDTGRTYVAYLSGYRPSWERLQEITAGEFGCRPSDVDLEEDEDADFLTVKGERVARVNLNG